MKQYYYDGDNEDYINEMKQKVEITKKYYKFKKDKLFAFLQEIIDEHEVFDKVEKKLKQK